jgi:preprotein translocase subunit SecG
MLLVTVIYVVICVLMITVVLLQKGAAGMGILGGSSNTLLGASSGDVLSRFTTWLAVLFIAGALFLSVLSSGKKSLIDSDVSAPTQQSQVPDVSLPQAPTALSISNTSN